MVRQRPYGANPRNRFPLGPQPRTGVMLVLIQVSSMNTRWRGSKRCCHDFQRFRLRATSARPCSRANSVFFEAQTLAAQELPDGIMGNLHTAHRQFVLQAMQGQMRRLVDPFDDEPTMRF